MRSFFAVGNGLFAMESINGLTSVYDCGSTNQATIDDAIDRSKGFQLGRIENVFISHYDKDHINGLIKLLTEYNVSRVILPMVSNLVRVLNSSTAKDSFLSDLILSPESVIKEFSPESDVIFIGEPNHGETNQGDTQDIDLRLVGNGSILQNNFQICKVDNWMYLIYNKRVLTDAELEKFYKNIHLPSNPTTDEIISALRAMSKATNLKKALNNVFTKDEIQKINDYSMIVWSGRIDHKLGCLYTGDYNAKKNIADLNKYYRNVLVQTDVIQIPHHGSIHNFDPGICGANAIHIVSAHKGPYSSRQIVNPETTIQTIKNLGYACEDTRNGDVMISE